MNDEDKSFVMSIIITVGVFAMFLSVLYYSHTEKMAEIENKYKTIQKP